MERKEGTRGLRAGELINFRSRVEAQFAGPCSLCKRVVLPSAPSLCLLLLLAPPSLTMKAKAGDPIPPLVALFHPELRALSQITAPWVTVIKQTPLQSAAPLVDELLSSNNEDVVLLSSGDGRVPHHASSPGVRIINVEDEDYAQAGPSTGRDHWNHLQTHIEAGSRDKPMTVIIDSLDGLLDRSAAADPAQAIFRRLQRIVNSLSPASRLILVISTSAPHSLQPEMAARLLDLLSASPLQYGSGGDDGATSVPMQVVSLHPPALWRHLLREYGTSLRPASTSARTAQQLRDLSHPSGQGRAAASAAAVAALAGRRSASGAPSSRRRDVASARESQHAAATAAAQAQAQARAVDEDVADLFDDQAATTDARLWSILNHLSARAQFGQGSWLNDVAGDGSSLALGEHCEALSACVGQQVSENEETWDAVEERITLRDLLGPDRSAVGNKARRQGAKGGKGRSEGEGSVDGKGWAILVSQHRLPGGKFGEEVLGVRRRRTGALTLVPLDMADHRSVSAPTTSGDDPHASLVSSLPFNLSLSTEQRQRRDDVALPFVPTDRIYEGYALEEEGKGLVRGSTGQSTIFFEPESGDEEDDEDPDDF